MKDPPVLTVTRRTVRKDKYVDYVGEYHLELLIRLRMLPVMVPIVEGTLRCLAQYMQGMKGLLLVEGEDVEPKRFKARLANFQYLEKTHPFRRKKNPRSNTSITSTTTPIAIPSRSCQALPSQAGIARPRSV